MMDDAKLKVIKSLREQLGKSYPTLQKYIAEDSFPAEVCLKVEEITGDKHLKIRAHEMRPDIFIPTPDQHNLALQALGYFSDTMSNEVKQLFILILNYIEHQAPSLYDDLLNSISAKKGGTDFVVTRKAHQNDGDY